MLNHTPLHEEHLIAHAKMTDFSGWDMPLHYGSQLAEHTAVREQLGIFDVSHMCSADLFGKDAKLALQTLLANDVAKLAVGQALYTAMLNEQGGVIDDLIVYRLNPQPTGEHYRVVHNAGCAEKDIAWVRKQITTQGWQVDYVPRRDLAMIAIQGPQALATCAKVASMINHLHSFAEPVLSLGKFYACSSDSSVVLARTGYTGEDGMEWMIPASLAVMVWRHFLAIGAKPCGLGARDTLRLEAGMCLYGQDLDEAHTPLECGIAWSVARKDSRPFIGRAVLDSMPPRCQSLGLRLMQGGILRAHQAVRAPDGTLGEITSGGFSPTHKMSIALARLPLSVRIGDTVAVNIRDQWLPAEVVPAKFI